MISSRGQSLSSEDLEGVETGALLGNSVVPAVLCILIPSVRSPSCEWYCLDFCFDLIETNIVTQFPISLPYKINLYLN